MYKAIRFYIQVDKHSFEGIIEIPNFQRLLRLTLSIKKDEKKGLYVTIEDSDYELKSSYY